MKSWMFFYNDAKQNNFAFARSKRCGSDSINAVWKPCKANNNLRNDSSVTEALSLWPVKECPTITCKQIFMAV